MCGDVSSPPKFNLSLKEIEGLLSFHMIKGVITCPVSSRAEISLRPLGWNFAVIARWISVRVQSTFDVHARVPFLNRAEILFWLHGLFTDFSARPETFPV